MKKWLDDINKTLERLGGGVYDMTRGQQPSIPIPQQPIGTPETNLTPETSPDTSKTAFGKPVSMAPKGSAFNPTTFDPVEWENKSKVANMPAAQQTISQPPPATTIPTTSVAATTAQPLAPPPPVSPGVVKSMMEQMSNRVNSEFGLKQPGDDIIGQTTGGRVVREGEQDQFGGYMDVKGGSPIDRVYIAKSDGKKRVGGSPAKAENTADPYWRERQETIGRLDKMAQSIKDEMGRISPDTHPSTYRSLAQSLTNLQGLYPKTAEIADPTKIASEEKRSAMLDTTAQRGQDITKEHYGNLAQTGLANAEYHRSTAKTAAERLELDKRVQNWKELQDKKYPSAIYSTAAKIATNPITGEVDPQLFYSTIDQLIENTKAGKATGKITSAPPLPPGAYEKDGKYYNAQNKQIKYVRD